MTKEEQEVVKRFVSDVYTSDIVFRTLKDTFLKDDGNKDVHYLASKTLAINLLDKAKNEMLRLRSDKAVNKKTQSAL